MEIFGAWLPMTQVSGPVPKNRNWTGLECNHLKGWHVLNPIINITNHPSSPRTWGLWNWDFSWVYHGVPLRLGWSTCQDKVKSLEHDPELQTMFEARVLREAGRAREVLKIAWKTLKNSWKMLKNNWKMINMLKHAEFVAGSPFLLQLLGSCSWRADLNLHCCTMTVFLFLIIYADKCTLEKPCGILSSLWDE